MKTRTTVENILNLMQTEKYCIYVAETGKEYYWYYMKQSEDVQTFVKVKYYHKEVKQILVQDDILIMII